MELLCFRIFIDITLDCAAEFFCQGLHILCGFPGRCVQELTAQGVIYVLDSLLVPSKGPWTTIQGWATSDCTESALDHKVEREGLKLLCCNLFCDVVGEAKKRPLGPLPASFPVKWHFPLLSYLPAKLWPVLLLWFWSSLELTWPLKQMSPYLCCSSVVHGMGIVPALENKFQGFTGNFSDRAGKGRKAMPICPFHNVDLETESLSSAHNHAEPGKNEPLIS